MTFCTGRSSDPVCPILMFTKRDNYRAIRLERRYAIAEEKYKSGQTETLEFEEENFHKRMPAQEGEGQNPVPLPGPRNMPIYLNALILGSRTEYLFESALQLCFSVGE